ncbi:hypothetical protein BJX61DRAFT_545197 [Aspergillus egyptiacus]|nr:hypothetical protein BJX61DRAFT_545197 [Aspergillus egyptiacus]
MALDYTRLNGRDEGDDLAKKVTPADMVRFMEIIISHNEVAHSRSIMQESLLAIVDSGRRPEARNGLSNED